MYLHTHTHTHTILTHTYHSLTFIHTHTHRIRNLFEAYIPGSNGTTASSNPALIAIPVAATVYMGLLYLFVVVTFFLASFVDPGIYPRGEWQQVDTVMVSMVIICEKYFVGVHL